MKIVGILGILLFLLGGLVFVIGGFVCKQVCGDTTSDCYKRMTVRLTSEADCEHTTEFMNKQMLMGAIPAGIGFLLAIVGLLMGVGGFLMARRKKAATPS